MKNVFAVGRYVLRTNYVPQLIALIPPKNLRKDCFKHEGFYLVKMPFRENIRKIHEVEVNNLINPQIETRLFIDRLTSNFNPLHYDDPMLARHYQGVEALALEQKTTEMKEPHNCLQPYFTSRNFINEDR
uniref:Ku domain-containing protein n=1 Tax=Strongyloides papillosus TaxID=174720 RepID=A0A0N5BXR9_STREA